MSEKALADVVSADYGENIVAVGGEGGLDAAEKIGDDCLHFCTGEIAPVGDGGALGHGQCHGRHEGAFVHHLLGSHFLKQVE